MKICIISPKAYPIFDSKIKSTIGGAEVQLSQIAKKLSENYKTYLLVGNYGQKNKIKQDKLILWKAIYWKKSKLKKISLFLKTIIKINPDIIMLRSMSTEVGIISILAKVFNKKFIYMVAHDRETDKSHENYKNFLKKMLLVVTFYLSEEIIVQNKYQKKNIKKYFGLKSTIINSSYPLTNTIPKHKKYILWVGRSESWKRPELFLKLAKNLKKYKFKMICPASTHNPKLAKKIKKIAIDIPNLKFVDYVPFQKINKEFEMASLFINTSVKEGFPNTFIQSAKNGTPVVSLNVNPNNYFEKYHHGINCKNNVEKMIIITQKLMNSHKKREKMGENGLKYVMKEHDIKKNIEKLKKLMKLKCAE